MRFSRADQKLTDNWLAVSAYLKIAIYLQFRTAAVYIVSVQDRVSLVRCDFCASKYSQLSTNYDKIAMLATSRNSISSLYLASYPVVTSYSSSQVPILLGWQSSYQMFHPASELQLNHL